MVIQTMELTKDDFYELEKLCDIAAGQVARDSAEIMKSLHSAGIKPKVTQGMFGSLLEAYTKYRTISAKLEVIRNG